MSQEKMTQEEIDSLLNTISIGEFVDPTTKLMESTLDKEQVKFKYNAVVSCKERLDYALTNCSFDEINEAQKNLHIAAFSNWLFRHGLDRKGYYELMNREAKARGLKPPFISS